MYNCVASMEDSKLIRFLALLAAVIAATIVFVGCGETASESDEHVGSESSEASGESGTNEHSRDVESGREGEESGTEYGLGDSFDEVRAGARLILSYDSGSNSFTGTVENTTRSSLRNVRVEVHLSNGIELGPTVPVNLEAGETTTVKLVASSNAIETWSAHPEVGGGDSCEGGGESEGREHGSGSESGEHGGGEGREGGGEHE